MCFRERMEEISDIYLTLTLISYTILSAPDIK